MAASIIAAVILAGGKSRRMGADKAWIDWGDRALLTHVAATLAPACDPVVVVGAQDQDLPPTPGASVVRDPPGHPGEGPLRGLLSGLAAVAAEGAALAFITGCDAPLVSPAHVEALVRALTPEAHAVAPMSESRRQVLSSVVRVTPALVTARALLDDGRRSLQALFDSLPVTLVASDTLPDANALRTCNTPEEVAALRALPSPQ